MIKLIRNSLIEKLIKSNIFFLYYSNHFIRIFRYFLLPYENDWNVFKKFKIKKNQIILDIGSHWGESFFTFKKYYANKIYCFEPDKDSFYYLKKITKNSNVKLFNFGISGNIKKQKLYFPTFRGKKLTLWGSRSEMLLKKRLKEFTFINPNKIKFISNIYNFKKINISREVGIIKIDVEGYEYDVLKGINQNCFRSAKLIFLEFNKNNYQSCERFLKKRGFESHIFFKNKLKKVNYNYIKKFTKLKKTSSNIIFLKIKKI